MQEKVKLQKQLTTLIKNVKDKRKKKTLYFYLERKEEAYRINKIKSLINFDEEYVSSIKSLPVKKEKKLIWQQDF